MFTIFLAAISGVFVILSFITNANLAKHVGVFQGTLINYVTGLFGISALMLFYGNMTDLSMSNMSSIPKWAYAGGFVGVMIVASSNIVVPKIPALYTTLLLFIGQIVAGLVIDYMQSGLIDPIQIAGGSLVLVGMVFNIWIDRSDNQSKTRKTSDESDLPLTGITEH